jgi:hypothetical protein
MTHPAAHATPAASTTAGWMVLALGDLRLAFPQRDIRLIGLATDLKLSAAGESPEVGWLLRKSGNSWPVYCFDEALNLQRPAPEGRHICVFFEAGGEMFGILSDRVWSLAADSDLAVEPLPACMTGLTSPVIGVARYQESVVAVLGGTEIATYLVFLRGREHGADQ